MPLIEGKGQKAFSHNVRAEMNADKPLKQSLAIAYAMKRKAKARDRKEDEEEHKASGGMVNIERRKRDFNHNSRNYAEGGLAEFEREEGASGYPVEDLPCPDCASGHCDRHSDDMMAHGGDVVARLMQKRMSEGGKIANASDEYTGGEQADFSSNEFDDLALRDDLKENYTAENSGDELGNDREDEDRRDIVSRIMNSMRKKGRMSSGYGSDYGR